MRHAGVQETMLRYQCYFEWCHSVKLAALNYCRPFDAVFIPAVLSTRIIILQIPDPGSDIVNNAAQKTQAETSCHDDSALCYGLGKYLVQ